MLIAVYGTLRKGFPNYYILEKEATYLGKFETSPIYTLKALTHFPGLLHKGHTSVVMEIYRVNQATAEAVDRLEGYSGPKDTRNMYNKEIIKTPYGEASVYFYAVPEHLEKNQNVESGDWKEFIKNKKIEQNA